MGAKSDKGHEFKKGDKARVWWPPTSDKAKTDFAGARLIRSFVATVSWLPAVDNGTVLATFPRKGREVDRSSKYAGMFWPVTITSCESSGKYRVVYDNGETELVKGEHVHNANAPVAFGREGVDLQV
jgi:hypothetical protein